jgi:hypothetical protein
MMDMYFDNTDEVKSIAPSGNIKGKRVFKIVSNINLFSGRRPNMERKERM